MRKVGKYELQAHGKNEINRIIMLEVQNVLPQLQQYLGKRIATMEGKSKKFGIMFTDNKPNVVPDSNGFASRQNCYIDFSSGSVRLHMSICLSGGKYEDKTYYCQYFDRTLYIGELQGFELKSVETLENIYSASGIDKVIDLDAELTKMERFKELEVELNRLKYSIKLDM